VREDPAPATLNSFPRPSLLGSPSPCPLPRQKVQQLQGVPEAPVALESHLCQWSQGLRALPDGGSEKGVSGLEWST
jgi:hypothetical protein